MLCALTCLLAQIWVDATLFATCQTEPHQDTDDTEQSTLPS